MTDEPLATEVRVRPATPADAAAWSRLRTDLWPEQPEDHPREIAEYFADPPERGACFVAEAEDGDVVGFAEVGLRDYAEGCDTSPVGYLEGIYVEDGSRRAGHARALVGACEAWARARGCTEMGSDRALDNEVSGDFHVAVGFEEVVRSVCYRKEL